MNDKKPLVSIVVPIYKTPEALLRNNIQHLIDQTFTNIEIVLVDDGSPDKCGAICDDYAKKDNRIKVIHQKNGGLCSARNAGQEMAAGKYITFVDGDDYLEIDAIEVVLEKVKSGDCYDIIIASPMKDYGGRVEYYEHSGLVNEKRYIDASAYLLERLFDFNSNISSVCAKLYSSSFLKNNNISHDVKLKQGSEEFLFNAEAFSRAKRVLFLERNIYHYIYNSDSITTRHDEANHRKVLEGFQLLEKKFQTDHAVLLSIYSRVQFAILTIAISGYFSDGNHESFFKARKKFINNILSQPISKKALKYGHKRQLDFSRRITLFFISCHLLLPVVFISRVRKMQKERKR